MDGDWLGIRPFGIGRMTAQAIRVALVLITRCQGTSIFTRSGDRPGIPTMTDPRSDSERERFWPLAGFPFGGTLERFNCPCLIEVKYNVKLVHKARVEVMTSAFGFRQVDHADRTLEQRLAQSRHRLIVLV